MLKAFGLSPNDRSLKVQHLILWRIHFYWNCNTGRFGFRYLLGATKAVRERTRGHRYHWPSQCAYRVTAWRLTNAPALGRMERI